MFAITIISGYLFVMTFQRARAPKAIKPVQTKCADCVKRANTPVHERVM